MTQLIELSQSQRSLKVCYRITDCQITILKLRLSNYNSQITILELPLFSKKINVKQLIIIH